MKIEISKETIIKLILLAASLTLLFLSLAFKTPIKSKEQTTVIRKNNSVTFPNIYSFGLSSTVVLPNPENNTDNLQYIITEPQEPKVIYKRKYTTPSEKTKYMPIAEKMVSENEHTYDLTKRGEVYCFVNENGHLSKFRDKYLIDDSDGIKVIKQRERLVYFSEEIPPGENVNWKVSDNLSEETDLNINIVSKTEKDDGSTTTLSMHVK